MAHQHEGAIVFQNPKEKATLPTTVHNLLYLKRLSLNIVKQIQVKQQTMYSILDIIFIVF